VRVAGFRTQRTQRPRSSIAAFCNTDGGILLIGVGDDGNIVGIEEDEFPNPDRFSVHLSNLLRVRLKPSPLGRVNHRIVKYSGRSVCIVEYQPAERETWFQPKGEPAAPELYIRVGPTSRALLGPEITDYYRRRFSPGPQTS
jgi:predicted HTH transcriptional regulator